MILNQNQQSDAQLIGDIQNNKVGIDTNNLDFITSLLTTNLYSQPIQSFIRETVANGWDSHVEAGTTDKPVIIRIFTNEKDEIQLAVRDYGTGLSPERFNEVYLNIGSSTKRESNDYIGQFGIGRFSSLAVSNIVHLTNYYQGTCNKFLMYKDAGKICIDKIFESTTTEENGLEVEVNTEDYSYDLKQNIASGIQQLTFYNNVYIDDPECLISLHNYTTCKEFNERKIIDFKTFKISSHERVGNSLLMGNVLYPINKTYIEKWFKGIDYVPFALKCNIGDVDITPSREMLLYSQKTINTIEQKCQEALEEFKEIAKTTFGSDFKTIVQYYKFTETNYAPIVLGKFEHNIIDISIPVKELSYYGLTDKLTICGQNIPSDLLDYYKKFRYTNLPTLLVTYEYFNSRFHVKNTRLSIARYVEDYYPADYIRLIDEPLKPVAKRYWTSHQDNQWKSFYFLNRKYVYSSFRRIVREFCATYKITPTNPTIKFIFKDFITNYTDLKSYNNWDVPQEFINAEKAATKQNKVATQQKARKCVIYRLISGRTYDSVSYDTSDTIENIRDFKGTVFFAEKGNPYLEEFYKIIYYCHFPRISLVEAASSNLSLLRELNNTIEFNTVFIEKNKLISKICTYIYLREKWKIDSNSIDSDTVKHIAGFYNAIRDIANYYYNLVIRSSNDTNLLKLLCKTYLDKGWLNYTIINLIESNIQYIKLNNLFSNIARCDLQEIVAASYRYITKDNVSNKKQFDSIKEILKPITDEYTPSPQLPHFDIG